jgi:hypothetical protein
MRRETRRESLARRAGFLLGFLAGSSVVLALWFLAAWGILTVTAGP